MTSVQRYDVASTLHKRHVPSWKCSNSELNNSLSKNRDCQMGCFGSRASPGEPRIVDKEDYYRSHPGLRNPTGDCIESLVSTDVRGKLIAIHSLFYAHLVAVAIGRSHL